MVPATNLAVSIQAFHDQVHCNRELFDKKNLQLHKTKRRKIVLNHLRHVFQALIQIYKNIYQKRSEGEKSVKFSIRIEYISSSKKHPG